MIAIYVVWAALPQKSTTFEVIAMKQETLPPPARKIGRPLSFDRDAALRAAMLVFWRHGYESSSIAELTDAMGVSAPSLYAAFGDKKRLFLEAIRLYAGDPEAMAAAIEGAPTSFDAARGLMVQAAIAYTGKDTPPGCLLASATASVSAAAVDVQAAVTDVRRSIDMRLRSRIRRDVAEGMLPAGTDPAVLAGLAMAVTQGMSVLARDGASRTALLRIAETAAAAWPACLRR